MGYSTTFKGTLSLNRDLTHKEWKELNELGTCYDKDLYEEYTDTPETLPDSYLQWIPNEDGTGIEWNGGEKFYDYIQWLRWLIKHYMKPTSLILNGSIRWQGEDIEDGGVLTVVENKVTYQKITIEGIIECPHCGEKFRPNEEQ